MKRRLTDALQWRTEALLQRLPTRTKVWLENSKMSYRIRLGRTSYDRAKLIHTFREAIRELERTNPSAPLGDYLEFGVYHGTSTSCMHAARAESKSSHTMRLFGFDSFEGLPSTAANEDDGVWAPGLFSSSLEFTRSNLRRWGVPDDDVTLIKGWFSDSLTEHTRVEHDIRHVGVAMIDCDLHSSTQTVLAFLAPLVHRRAIFVFDDWDSSNLGERGLGEARAFREFLDANPELSASEIPGLNYKTKPGPRVFLIARN